MVKKKLSSENKIPKHQQTAHLQHHINQKDYVAASVHRDVYGRFSHHLQHFF